MVQTSYDSCNNSTGYGYSAAYYGAFPTTVTNALSQTTTYTFDFSTGLVASVQDPNSLLTTYGYDEMWRLTSITYPDNGVDTVTFQETWFPVTDTISTQINASTFKRKPTFSTDLDASTKSIDFRSSGHGLRRHDL